MLKSNQHVHRSLTGILRFAWQISTIEDDNTLKLYVYRICNKTEIMLFKKKIRFSVKINTQNKREQAQFVLISFVQIRDAPQVISSGGRQ